MSKRIKLRLFAGTVLLVIIMPVMAGIFSLRRTYIVTDSGVSTSVTCLGGGAAALDTLGVRLGDGDSYFETALGDGLSRITVRRSSVFAAPAGDVTVDSPVFYAGASRVRNVSITYRPASLRTGESAPSVTQKDAGNAQASEQAAAHVPYLVYHEEGYFKPGENGVITTPEGEELRYTSVISCSATAYTTERQENKITATGTVAHVGGIAVDPKLIPYGTRLYIISEAGTWSYGYATAEDCGGGIKGNKIDLFFDTYDECIDFGVRNALVYVLE